MCDLLFDCRRDHFPRCSETVGPEAESLCCPVELYVRPVICAQFNSVQFSSVQFSSVQSSTVRTNPVAYCCVDNGIIAVSSYLITG